MRHLEKAASGFLRQRGYDSSGQKLKGWTKKRKKKEKAARQDKKTKRQIEKLKKLPYVDYLKTKHWRKLRKQVLKRDERRCTICGSYEDLNVHHYTYERLGHEKLDDLVTLCRWCHAEEHLDENYADVITLRPRPRKRLRSR